MSEKVVKCLQVGDGGIGKTSLLQTFVKIVHPGADIPVVFDNYIISVNTDDTAVKVGFCDTEGQEDYSRLRPLSYPGTDVFFLCFSVVSPASMENIVEKWWPEVTHHVPKAQLVLVGTEIDLRIDQTVVDELKKQGQHPVTMEEGEKLAKKLRAVLYKECSVKYPETVNSLFMDSLQTILYPPGADKKQCLIS